MKKILSLVLALCLLCTAAAAVAETETVEIPPQVAVEDVSAFYGVWMLCGGVYHDVLLTIDQAVEFFGGQVPFFQIDEENITSIVGEETEAHPYIFDAESSAIMVVDPETNVVAVAACMLEDGTLEIDLAMDEEVIRLFLLPYEEVAE